MQQLFLVTMGTLLAWQPGSFSERQQWGERWKGRDAVLQKEGVGSLLSCWAEKRKRQDALLSGWSLEAPDEFRPHSLIQFRRGWGRVTSQTGHQHLDLLMLLWSKVWLRSTGKGIGWETRSKRSHKMWANSDIKFSLPAKISHGAFVRLRESKHLLLKTSRDEDVFKQHLKQEINLCNKVQEGWECSRNTNKQDLLGGKNYQRRRRGQRGSWQCPARLSLGSLRILVIIVFSHGQGVNHG